MRHARNIRLIFVLLRFAIAMPKDCVSYQNSGFFSPLIVDYLNRKQQLEPLYNRFPDLENFAAQIVEKQQNFAGNRSLLADTLARQYANLEYFGAVTDNIERLRNPNTFTVVTGHQLNLFTGPLYFLYKIASTINLCQTLKKHHPEYDFVPIYWMATEDHDFEEINFFKVRRQKLVWKRADGGAVGRLDTDGLDGVLEAFKQVLGNSTNADTLKQWFEEAYLNHQTLADATRWLAHKLFGSRGLVILDADDRALKAQFTGYVKEELLNQRAWLSTKSSAQLLAPYGLQVNAREVNLFYLDNGLRERIVEQDGRFQVLNTPLSFSKEGILALVDASPEKFSPNVVMRPLYQEVILPNLCYIGGGGELAYWLQLKPYFDRSQVTFPMLLLRDSVLVATRKQTQKADALGLSWNDLFLPAEDLRTVITKRLSALDLDFSPQKKFLTAQFDELEKLALSTDKSFGTAVAAQKAKQLKGLENLEKKLLRAEKRRHEDILNRAVALRNELFPGGGLQERQENFSGFYADYGPEFIEAILSGLNPLDQQFKILVF